MTTLINLLSELGSVGINPIGLKIYSMAFGDVSISEFAPNPRPGIITIDSEGNKVFYDEYGRLSMRGKTLLYPDQSCGDWNSFVKGAIVDFYNKKLVPGSICLYKPERTEAWRLALFLKIDDAGYTVKAGPDNEVVKYCMSYEKNEDFLGRILFPDWYVE